MKVLCNGNTGKFLRSHEYRKLTSETQLGRFGVTGYGVYNEITIGSEYLVMGIIIFKDYQAYLVDDSSIISACPCQLFTIVDDHIPNGWHFRLIQPNEDSYPFLQAIFSFQEFCQIPDYYNKLIIDKSDDAELIYFSRKEEFYGGKNQNRASQTNGIGHANLSDK